MAEIVWSAEVLDALADLPDPDQIAVLVQIQNLRRFPTMYPESRDPRLVGHRRMVVKGRWAVYYRLEGDACILAAVIDIRSSLYRG
jgi:plasmid stabilization system protein ParE